jgi:histidyl-tRNA synthetase
MGEQFIGPRGTNDLFPPETQKWVFVEEIIRRKAESFGFQEIRTPIFEHTELFSRGIGEGTDIAAKEMYTFIDKGGRSITLRPELTAPAVRAYLQNFPMPGTRIQDGRKILQGSPPFVKWCYFGPAFRYERPQSGRYRQFHQFGVEAIGSKHPDLDIEVIQFALQVFKSFFLENLEVKLNSIGCSSCRPSYREVLRKHFYDHLEQLCEDCKTHRYEKNPLRILDCKSQKCAPFILGSPIPIDYLCEECKTHFNAVQHRLKELQVPYSLDPRLVRGLDYYTKTVFEVISGSLGAQNSVCGGGRYDDLIETLGGPSVPAVGFAAGMERLMLLIQDNLPGFKKAPLLYAVPLGEKAEDFMVPLIFRLREEAEMKKIRLHIERDYQGKNLSAQLKEASRLRADFAVILGENELNEKKLILKNLNTRKQEDLPLNSIENSQENLKNISNQILEKITVFLEEIKTFEKKFDPVLELKEKINHGK